MGFQSRSNNEIRTNKVESPNSSDPLEEFMERLEDIKRVRVKVTTLNGKYAQVSNKINLLSKELRNIELMLQGSKNSNILDTINELKKT